MSSMKKGSRGKSKLKNKDSDTTRRRNKLKETSPKLKKSQSSKSNGKKSTDKTESSRSSSLSCIFGLVVRLALLAFVLACLVLIDVSFMHTADLKNRKPRLSLTIPKQEAPVSPKATANDIVSDAISDLDALLAMTRKKRVEMEAKEQLLAQLAGPDMFNRILQDPSLAVSEEPKKVKCRKASGDDDDEDESKRGGCAEGEEEYVEEGMSEERVIVVVKEAIEELSARTGKMGMANLKDGFDLRGVSSGLEHRFVNLLEDPAEKVEKTSGKEESKSTTKKQENNNLLAQSYREMVWQEKTVDPKFIQFQSDLRDSGRTYSHVSKKSDFERGLKALGYKQSTKTAKKSPFWIGHEGESCPSFKNADDLQIGFCQHYLQDYKEQEQYQLLRLFSHRNPSIPIRATDIFPQTWRLYKIGERRALKTRCGNESLPNEGGPYVTKYTVAGTIGLSLGMWDKIKRSDKSLTVQVKEAKNKAIVQVYINNPYIFQDRKFIIRSYAVIVSASPMIVLFHDGALYRCVSKFTPFTKRDGNYHRSSHFTNDQKSHNSGPLKSSNLYSSLDLFQKWLNQKDLETPDFVQGIRNQIRAQAIMALYALVRPNLDDYKAPPKLPSSTAVLQPACFDFLLDSNRKLWFLGANTGQHCYINMGGNSFRPSWKQELMEALTDNVLTLAEEVLWRRSTKQPVSTMSFFTQTKLQVLIDETFPDWNFEQEIQDHLSGTPVRQNKPETEGVAQVEDATTNTL